MEQNEFDKYIKELLSDHAADGKADWDAMHQKLVEENILEEEHGFDRLVKDAVSDVKANYNSEHWSMLRERLLTTAYLKKRVVIVKVTELAALVFFVWVILTLMPIKKALYDTPSYRQPYAELPSIFEGFKSLFTLGNDTNSVVIPKKDIESTTAAFTVEQRISKSKNRYSTADATSLVSLSSLPNRSLKLTHERNITPPIAEVMCQNKKFLDASSVSFSTGTGYNRVSNTSPYQPVEHISSIGYQASVDFGTRRGNYEVFSGLGVYNLQYNPIKHINVVKSVEGEIIPTSKLSDVNYNFLYIPFGVRYHFAEQATWGAYVVASSNFNILATANYGTTPLTRAEEKTIKSSGLGSLRSNNYDIDRFSTGILQGGSFLDNFSVTASLGFGVMRSLNDDTALFIQPTYTRNYSFGGVSSLEESIQNIRVDLGVRVKL